MDALKPPLTNLQMELLNLFALDLSEKQLLEIRDLLTRHFADRASDAIDAFVEAEGLTEADFEQWAHGHDRARRR